METPGSVGTHFGIESAKTLGGVALSNMKLRGARRIFLAVTTLVAGSLMTGTKPVHATPATLGFYPATDIYGKGNFHYDADSYGRGIKTDALVSNGITYGAGPDRDGIFGRTEIGFDYILGPDGLANQKVGKRFLGNIKTQLYNDDASGTRVVIGAWSLGSRDVFAANIGYITGSKTFDFGRVHLGVANSFAKRATIASSTPGDDDRFSIQLGYDKYITPKLQFAVDFYSGKNAYAGVQPTLYYYVNEKANFGVGYFRTNSDGVVTPAGRRARNQVYVCFDYNFDFAKTATVTSPAPVPETVPGAPATN